MSKNSIEHSFLSLVVSSRLQQDQPSLSITPRYFPLSKGLMGSTCSLSQENQKRSWAYYYAGSLQVSLAVWYILPHLHHVTSLNSHDRLLRSKYPLLSPELNPGLCTFLIGLIFMMAPTPPPQENVSSPLFSSTTPSSPVSVKKFLVSLTTLE